MRIVKIWKMLVSESEVAGYVTTLTTKYRRINLYFSGTKRHEREGLAENQVLVTYWNPREAEA